MSFADTYTCKNGQADGVTRMNKDFYFRSSPHLPVYRLLSTTIVLTRVAGRYGIGSDELLEGSGISTSDLADPRKLITAVQEISLIRRFLRIVKIPWIGLEVGREYQFVDNGILGFAVMCCETWSEALTLAFSYTPLTGTYFQYEMRRTGSEGQVSLHELANLGEIGPAVCEANVASIHAMASLAAGTPHVYKEVQFSYPKPEYAARYEAVLHCPVRFDAPEHRILYDGKILDIPLKLANPLMKSALEKECAQLSLRLTEHETLSSRIRQELLLGCDEFPTLNQLARRISISPRTIRRRLGEEKTSYMGILTDIRREKASELLRSTGLSMENVADRLGFNDVSSFFRAFKAWEGCTPGRYRERHSGGREV
jgi:AraC-like DNA-binding protein